MRPHREPGGDDASAARFYDELAADYHLLFEDWWTAAEAHGAIIGAVLADEGIVPPASVLDCACGIGTQALALAARGYRVTGTDISGTAVRRAEREADSRGISVTLQVADMRRLDHVVSEAFDAVIACDNSLPHLRTDDDLQAALAAIRTCLVPGGVFVASVRDYDELAAGAAGGSPVSLWGEAGSRHAVGQAWRWAPDRGSVTITLFVMDEQGDGSWRATSHETVYRALGRHQLGTALQTAGFAEVRWHSPEETGYHQPVVTARRAG